MSTYNLESAERSATHTLHDTTAVAKVAGKYPYALSVTTEGSYTVRLKNDSADTTLYLLVGVVYPLVPALIKATGAPSGATTCVVFYRQ